MSIVTRRRKERSNTTAGWAASTTALLEGEWGYDTDTGEAKIGNGIDLWGALPLPPSAGGGGVSLGETSTTAYRGDRGKIAYDHSQTTGNPHSTTAGQVGADPSGSAAAAQAHAIQRANHTGTQAISTVTGLQTALDSKVGSNGSVTAVVALTQTAYDALTPDATTLYFITGP